MGRCEGNRDMRVVESQIRASGFYIGDEDADATDAAASLEAALAELVQWAHQPERLNED